VEYVAGAELGGCEGMPVQASARAIAVDSPTAPVRVTHILDDNELASDATGVSDERGASARWQVVEEMAGEDPVELAVAERQRRDIALEHTCMRHAGRGNLDHPSALVERHQLAAQMLGQEAGAARDVEHSNRGQRPHHADELLDLLGPTGSLVSCERSRVKPPGVVLGRTLVEVSTHLIVGLVLGHPGDPTLASQRRDSLRSGVRSRRSPRLGAAFGSAWFFTVPRRAWRS
jgi:hypothetical protein